MPEKVKTLTWDFVQLIHELVLQLGKGLILLAGARAGHVGGVGASRGGGGGGGLGRCRRQCFPSTLIHRGDAGKPGRCWTSGERRKQSGLFIYLFICRWDRCMSEAARSACQMTELTQTVWAAAGSAWVNISWGPEWIGQHAEFRTKLLTHCLNSRLASQSRDKMIIYYSRRAQAVNLCTAAGLIEIMCFYKSTESTVNNVAVQRTLLTHYLITSCSLYTTGVFTLHSGLL